MINLFIESFLKSFYSMLIDGFTIYKAFEISKTNSLVILCEEMEISEINLLAPLKHL